MTDGGEQTAPAGDVAVPASPAPNIVTLPSGETVVLHPKITMAIGAAATSIARSTAQDAIRMAAQSGASSPNVLGAEIIGGLAEIYLRFGIMAWSFTEKAVVDGAKVDQPVPITPENIERLLPYTDGGREVAEAADTLYSNDVFRPLAKQLLGLSQTGPTEGSTPPTQTSGSTLRGHSKRSSRKSSAAGKRSAVRAR